MGNLLIQVISLLRVIKFPALSLTHNSDTHLYQRSDSELKCSKSIGRMKEKILELRRAINVEPVVFLFLFGTYLISLPER